jgi:oligopeptidase B
MCIRKRLAAVVVSIIACGSAAAGQTDMKPPIAKKVPTVLKIHGYEITDNYAWLRDRGDKKDPEVIKYLEAENAYTEAKAASFKELSETLYKEMLGRIKQDDTNVPYLLGGFWYFTKTVEGKQYPQYFRSRQRDGKDAELLLDQNVLAEGHKYFAIGSFEPSDDGRILAFSVDTNGYRQYTLQFKDLTTGQMLADRIERVTSIEWSADGK